MQVRQIEVTYENFDQFTKSQEFLISEGTVDYLEGFIHFRANASNASDVYYSIELAIYYDDIAIAKKVHLQLCYFFFYQLRVYLIN